MTHEEDTAKSVQFSGAGRAALLRAAMKRCIITAIFREDCMAEAKKKVYVETSVVSNLTARRSYNLK